jgi:hypothetical protein
VNKIDEIPEHLNSLMSIPEWFRALGKRARELSRTNSQEIVGRKYLNQYDRFPYST